MKFLRRWASTTPRRRYATRSWGLTLAFVVCFAISVILLAFNVLPDLMRALVSVSAFGGAATGIFPTSIARSKGRPIDRKKITIGVAIGLAIFLLLISIVLWG